MGKLILMGFLLILLYVTVNATIINVPADQPTIQAGINVAVDGDTVLVQPGTYLENINYYGKLITVASLFLTTQDTTYISQTIIDGSNTNTVIYFNSGEDSTAVLCGFTITNGSAIEYGGGIKCFWSNPSLNNLNVINNSAPSAGGGIYCSNSSPIIVNVKIAENTAHVGGGIYCIVDSNPNLLDVSIENNNTVAYGGGIVCAHSSSPSLKNVIISNNLTESYGAGIICSYNSSPSLENVIIVNNSANYRAGGMYCVDNSSPKLENVSIENNSAEDGGGIYCRDDSSPILKNVLIANNTITSYSGCGGGIYCNNNSSLILENVTIFNNSASLDGGGIYCRENSNPTLINSIMWNNSPEEIYFSQYQSPNSITISYSDIQGGYDAIITNNNGTIFWEEENINEDPQFVGSGDHHCMLMDISPCINTGIQDTTGLNLPEYDLAGNPRLFGGRIDMGAFENQNVVVMTGENLVPLFTILNQNYPNPFNPETIISYQLPENGKVELAVYNLKGQKVKQLFSDQLSAGEHSVVWDGRDENNLPVGSGIYFYKLKSGNFEKIKKMILLK